MKKLLLLLTVLLSGCAPYYVAPAPVYYNPAPVYVAPPPPVYVPRCYWVKQWNGYTRQYQNVRVCR